MSTKRRKNLKKNRLKYKKLTYKGGIFTFLKTLLVTILSITFVLGGIFIGAAAGCISTTTPITDEELALDSLTTTIYDVNGTVIAQLKGSDNKNRIPVKISQVPKHLQNAFVAVEDHRFFEHQGVDLKRTGGAILNLFLPGGSKFGGSTITQQLVKNITGDDRTSIPRKIREIWRAVQLEQRLTKEQILETYMNVIYMGYDCYGVQAASKAYFSKNVWELTLAESALLAGITNNPYRYNPLTEKGRENAIARQKLILKLMLQQGLITEEEHKAALAEELVFNDDYQEESRLSSIQSYFVDQVIIDAREALMSTGLTKTEANNLIYGGGIKIYSTMDKRMQDIMDAVYQDVENFPSNKKITDPDSFAQSAMVIIDPENGHVKAMYGGYGKKTVSNALNRATQMMRPAGSSIKPIIVYAPQIDSGLITPATVIDDIPVYMNEKKPTERYPTNYSQNRYPGLTTVRDAVARSSNVVAARVFVQNMNLGLNYLANLGIDRRDERYVSVALGGFNKGVNPLQMAAAFVPFANKGFYYEPMTFTMIQDRNGKVLYEKRPEARLVYNNEDTPYLMTSIMESVINSSTGTARNRISVKDKNGEVMPVAGKTGTSNYYRDTWFVGYTPYLVGATWYGFDMNDIIPSGERSHGTYIWNKVMSEIHKKFYVKKDFYKPSTIVSRQVCKYSGKLATDICKHDPRGNAVITEYFSSSNVPTEYCDVHVKIEICKTTGHRANEHCPVDSSKTGVYIKRPKPYVPVYSNEPKPEDLKYDLPSDLANLPVCTEHTANVNPSPSPTEPNDNTPTPAPDGETEDPQTTPPNDEDE